MDNTTDVTQDVTTVDDPFMAERPDFRAPAEIAANDGVDLPAPNENGLVETDSYYFAPDSINQPPAQEDSIYGYDGRGTPIFESEYLANPDAYTFADDQSVLAGGSFIRKGPVLPDPVVGTNQFGQPVHASEYYKNPTEFNPGTVAVAAKSGGGKIGKFVRSHPPLSRGSVGSFIKKSPARKFSRHE